MVKYVRGLIHEMDNPATGERLDGARVQQYFPYISLKFGYQRL